MNVRYKLTLWVGVAFVLFLSACVKSDPDDCVSVPKGIDVYFYSLSPCQTDTVYPVDITDLMVGVFDQEGILVTHSKQANVELEKEFFRQLEVSSGLYTVVACSGLGDDSFQVEEWKDGVTTKKDVLFRIKRAGGYAYSLRNKKVFYGESPAVYVAEDQDPDAPFEKATINMQEITNRLSVTVEGLDLSLFDILIESNNGTMNFDGTVAPDEVLAYEPAYVPSTFGFTAFLRCSN